MAKPRKKMPFSKEQAYKFDEIKEQLNTDFCLTQPPSYLFSTSPTTCASSFSSSFSSSSQIADLIPLIDKSDVSENINRTVILLAGPGGFAFNKDFILKMQNALKSENTAVVRIGDGESDLTETEIAFFFNEISNIDTNITLFLQCHGEMHFGEHVIFLNKTPIKSKMFFSDLSSNLSGKPIDIFSTACYGSMAAFLQNQLPKGSTYAALSKEVVSGMMIKNLITHLEENFHSKIDRTAEALLMLCLSNAFKIRSQPAFVVSGNNMSDINAKLNIHLKHKFSQSELSLIEENLNFLAPIDKLQIVITEIENSEYIPAKNLGLALAICHAASGSIQKPLDHEINSFQLSKASSTAISFK